MFLHYALLLFVASSQMVNEFFLFRNLVNQIKY